MSCSGWAPSHWRTFHWELDGLPPLDLLALCLALPPPHSILILRLCLPHRSVQESVSKKVIILWSTYVYNASKLVCIACKQNFLFWGKFNLCLPDMAKLCVLAKTYRTLQNFTYIFAISVTLWNIVTCVQWWCHTLGTHRDSLCSRSRRHSPFQTPEIFL